MSAPRRSTPASLAALAILGALGGCTTLGGHVKGSFACQAPEGICAPSSTIDDRALAMISGDPSAPAATVPAGPFVPSKAQARPVRTAAPARPAMPATGAQRTSEKVLRVVFQPYIDDYGRLHEASVVRTVVRGEWQTAAVAPPVVRAVDPSAAGTSLADAVDRADPPAALAAIDPDQPSAAAVTAARAKVDPIAAIKADVASRLAARPAAVRRVGPSGRRGRLVRTATSTAFRPAPAAVGPATAAGVRPPMTVTAAAPMPARAAPPLPYSAQPLASAPPPAASAAAAAARIRSDPRVAAAAAAAQAGGRPVAAPAPPSVQPVLRATSFPGASTEDN